jgi:hypothetical protein
VVENRNGNRASKGNLMRSIGLIIKLLEEILQQLKQQNGNAKPMHDIEQFDRGYNNSPQPFKKK